MSLNSLTKVVLVAAFASSTPNAGCNKTGHDSPDGQSAQAALAPLEPREKELLEEFLECGKGMETTEENYGRVRDCMYGSDCHAIREERRRRIAEIPSLFKCVDGQIELTTQPSRLADLTDFNSAGSATRGNCAEVYKDAMARVQRVLYRMDCDEKGLPYEKLEWGEAKGGLFYNP